MRRLAVLGLIAGAATLGAGCVERDLEVRSDPPGSLVYLNDQEIGRTPFNRRFTWYGYYDVQVRKEGYQTIKTVTPIIAPWWQWLPFDFVAELLPLNLRDSHTVSYALTPLSHAQVDPHAIVKRAENLERRLESTHIPTTQTQPATRPARH